jgi:hypothetical protein
MSQLLNYTLPNSTFIERERNFFAPRMTQKFKCQGLGQLQALYFEGDSNDLRLMQHEQLLANKGKVGYPASLDAPQQLALRRVHINSCTST